MEEARTTHIMVEGTMAMTTILVSLHLRAPFLCYGSILLLSTHGLSNLALQRDLLCSPPSVDPASSDKQALEMRCLQACQDLSVGLNPIMSPHMAKSEMHRHADSNGGWGNYYGNNYGYSGGYDSGYGGGEPL